MMADCCLMYILQAGSAALARHPVRQEEGSLLGDPTTPMLLMQIELNTHMLLLICSMMPLQAQHDDMAPEALQ